MTDHLIELDLTKSLVEDPRDGHNRWHPGIAPIRTIAPGDTITADLRDGLDYQIWPHSGIDDAVALDITRGHPMTGPFYVEGAEPGDVLDVHIREVNAYDFGFTMFLPGVGMLADRFAEPFLVKWRLENGLATSDEMPGVAVPGDPFLGVIGVAPSPERLAAFTRREADLAATGAFVLPPEPRNAVTHDPALDAVAIRTVPPRENGGNMDVRRMYAGTHVQLPVEVPGALLSVGDPHFAQGDGESCGVAIETTARTVLDVRLLKAADLPGRAGVPTYRYRERAPREYFATTGYPITRAGENLDMDVYAAAAMALDELVDHLVRDRGISAAQAYVLVSVAADLHVSSIVNIPNPCVSAALPTDLFVS
jgi:formamidase